MDKISVIGGGHVGISLFCDLFVRLPDGGARTRVFSVREDVVSRFDEGIDLTFNDLFNGSSHPVSATNAHFGHLFSEDSLDWLRASTYVVVTVPDIPYLRPRILNYLLDHGGLEGKVLVLCRGGQGSAPYFANWVRKDSRLHRTHIVLIEDSFYGTRFHGNQVDCKRKYKINISILSRDTAQALKKLQDIFPPKPDSPYRSWPHFEVRPAANLLFDPLGYIIHVGVAFSDRNLERTSRGEIYTHYVEGIDRPLAEKLERLDLERVAIARAYGVSADPFPRIIARQYNKPLLPDFYDMMQSCRDIYKSTSATSLNDLRASRYVSEDIPPLFTMLRLAEIAKCSVPATRSYLTEIRQKMRVLAIAEESLMTYVNEFPKVSSVKALVDLLNYPIPSDEKTGVVESELA